MTKLVIYRNNSAYEQFLAPAISDRKDLEIQVFPVGMDPAEITAWVVENADRVRGMEKVYLDKTCYEAGKSVPSQRLPNVSIWSDVETNYGNFDHDLKMAAESVLKKATVKETIAEIIQHMLTKEVPDKVLLMKDHMADHDLFGLGILSSDWEEEARRDAEILRSQLEASIGKPVNYITVEWPDVFDTNVSIEEADKVWLFYDRHCTSELDFELEMLQEKISCLSEFKVPIENLIQDALAFGIELDTEAFSQAIEEIVADW